MSPHSETPVVLVEVVGDEAASARRVQLVRSPRERNRELRLPLLAARRRLHRQTRRARAGEESRRK